MSRRLDTADCNHQRGFDYKPSLNEAADIPGEADKEAGKNQAKTRQLAMKPLNQG